MYKGERKDAIEDKSNSRHTHLLFTSIYPKSNVTIARRTTSDGPLYCGIYLPDYPTLKTEIAGHR